MPRGARIKTPKSIYHIMVRSIKEIKLFNDYEDKTKYLKLIKENQVKLNFKVYAYCLMDNHGHFMIDANGADISTIMHAINVSFARYYNKKYERYGHVFQDRFNSRIVYNNRYAVALSAYIHNNAKDLPKYKDNIEGYEYSSLKCYIENKADDFAVIDKKFLTQIINLKYMKVKDKYLELVKITDDLDKIKEELDVEFKKPNSEYRSERKILVRDYSVKVIIDYIINYTKIDKKQFYMKYNKAAKETRALSAFFMRCFCNYTQKEICGVIGNITASRVSVLCSLGYNLIMNETKYKNIVEDFIQIQ